MEKNLSEKENDILSKSREVLLTNPEVSMNKLLQEIGYSRSTFYRIFSSKGELYTRLFLVNDTELKEYYESIDARLEDEEKYIKLLRFYHSKILNLNPNVALTIITQDLQDSDALERHQKSYLFSIFIQLFGDRINNNSELTSFDIDKLVKQLFYGTIGAIQVWAYTDEEFDLLQEIEDTARIVLNVLNKR